MKNNVILHLLPKSDGGICQHVKAIICSMDKLPFKNVIAGPGNNSLGQELKELGYCYEGIRWLNSEQLNLFYLIQQIRQLIKKHGPSLIHCHGHKMSLAGRLAMKTISSSYSSNCRSIVTIHNFTPNSIWGKTFQRLNNYLDNQEITAQIIAVSKALLDQEVSNINKDKAKVIYNGVELNSFAPSLSMRERAASDMLTLGVVARLAPQKGLSFLIDALSIIQVQYPKTRLIIVGFGPEKSRLTEQITSLGLEEQVEIIEGVSDVRPYLQEMDIFVMPSISEGLSIATIEAMASAKPIVAANVGGLKELIVDGQSGILVPSANVNKLAEAIMKLAEKADYAKQLGIGAQQRAMLFSKEQMIAETHQVYFAQSKNF